MARGQRQTVFNILKLGKKGQALAMGYSHLKFVSD